MFQPIINGKIQIHPKTKHATKVWNELKVNQIVNKVTPLSLDTPVYSDKVRFVCISDTHNKVDSVRIPNGDVLLHAGDFSMIGQPSEIELFNDFLGNQPHKYKIVIAGNHEVTFDPTIVQSDSLKNFYFEPSTVLEYMASRNITKMSELLTNCTAYLEDTETAVYGIRIYGSPWQPNYGNMGFNLNRGEECLKKWDSIPTGIDVLMTHGPPLGHGDLCCIQVRAGCVELLHTVQHRVRPKYHVFGHIHEGYGITTDGVTTYINASTCNRCYNPDNRPIIFDLPLPDGWVK